MITVWILFSVANDYNQPERAFERLFFHAPTYDDLKEFGFTEEEAKHWFKPHRGNIQYWVEKFTSAMSNQWVRP